MNKISLITSFYVSNNTRRTKELITCLKKNVKNKFISKIYLFLDSSDNLCEIKKNVESIDKITICNTGHQPLYSDLFLFANTLRNQICLIMNSDIWLYGISNLKLLNPVNNNFPKNFVYCLTRHEYDFSSPLINNFAGSHDAFLFKSPINKEIIKHIAFQQNIWGSENVLIYEFNKLGYQTFNPCKEIIIIHEHRENSGEERENSDKEGENSREESGKVRQRINCGGFDGDHKWKVRNNFVFPCSPLLKPWFLYTKQNFFLYLKHRKTYIFDKIREFSNDAILSYIPK